MASGHAFGPCHRPQPRPSDAADPELWRDFARIHETFRLWRARPSGQHLRNMGTGAKRIGQQYVELRAIDRAMRGYGPMLIAAWQRRPREALIGPKASIVGSMTGPLGRLLS